MHLPPVQPRSQPPVAAAAAAAAASPVAGLAAPPQIPQPLQPLHPPPRVPYAQPTSEADGKSRLTSLLNSRPPSPWDALRIDLGAWQHSDAALVEALRARAEADRARAEQFRLERAQKTLEIMQCAIRLNVPGHHLVQIVDPPLEATGQPAPPQPPLGTPGPLLRHTQYGSPAEFRKSGSSVSDGDSRTLDSFEQKSFMAPPYGGAQSPRVVPIPVALSSPHAAMPVPNYVFPPYASPRAPPPGHPGAPLPPLAESVGVPVSPTRAPRPGSPQQQQMTPAPPPPQQQQSQTPQGTRLSRVRVRPHRYSQSASDLQIHQWNPKLINIDNRWKTTSSPKFKDRRGEDSLGPPLKQQANQAEPAAPTSSATIVAAHNNRRRSAGHRHSASVSPAKAPDAAAREDDSSLKHDEGVAVLASMASGHPK